MEQAPDAAKHLGRYNMSQLDLVVKVQWMQLWARSSPRQRLLVSRYKVHGTSHLSGLSFDVAVRPPDLMLAVP